MKTPNLISLVAMLGVILPAIISAVSQQFPPELYWWSAAIGIVLGGVLKCLEVYVFSQPQPQILPMPPMPAGVSAAAAPAPTAPPSKLKALFLQ